MSDKGKGDGRASRSGGSGGFGSPVASTKPLDAGQAGINSSVRFPHPRGGEPVKYVLTGKAEVFSLAATALHLGIPVISRDRKIQKSTLTTVW